MENKVEKVLGKQQQRWKIEEKRQKTLKGNQEVQNQSNRGPEKKELKIGRNYQRRNTRRFPRTEGHESFH